MKSYILYIMAISCIVPFSYSKILIADAVDEFSGTQGNNNWYYGYYDGDHVDPYSPADFELLNNYASDEHWYINEAGQSYWTTIFWDHMHPNGTTTSGGRTPAEHWVVRRWICEVSGIIEITGHVARIQPSAGDGALSHINIGGDEIYTQHIGINDFGGYDYTINAQVQQGTIVDFIVSPGGTDWADGTIFTAEIYIPEPATLSLLALGGFALLRRRK